MQDRREERQQEARRQQEDGLPEHHGAHAHPELQQPHAHPDQEPAGDADLLSIGLVVFFVALIAIVAGLLAVQAFF